MCQGRVRFISSMVSSNYDDFDKTWTPSLVGHHLYKLWIYIILKKWMRKTWENQLLDWCVMAKNPSSCSTHLSYSPIITFLFSFYALLGVFGPQVQTKMWHFSNIHSLVRLTWDTGGDTKSNVGVSRKHLL